GKVKEASRRPDGEWIGGVKAQKPNARLTLGLHVEANVELRKRRQSWEVREWPAHHPSHPKRHDTNPGCPAKFLNFQAIGNQRPQHFEGHGAVNEEQVEPRLAPRQPSRWHRPWAMVGPG